MSERLDEQAAASSPEKPPKKVLFIDDGRKILESIRLAFEENPGVECTECHSVEDALNAIESSKPDIIFLDNSFGPVSNAGLIVADVIQAKYPDIKIYSTTTSTEILAEYASRNITHIQKHDFRGIRQIIEGKTKLS